MLALLIFDACGRNIIIKPYQRKSFDYSKMPHIYTYIRYFGFNAIHKYSSLTINLHEYPTIIYCCNLGRLTVEETDMWTKYVPLDIWGLVGLCLVLSSMLYTTADSRNWLIKRISRTYATELSSVCKFVSQIDENIGKTKLGS